MTKQELLQQWNDWMAAIAAFLGPLTSLIFEEKYSIKQIIARLLIGGACAVYLGGYIGEHLESDKLKSLSIYLCGFGGYYLLKGLVKGLEIFGLDPAKGISFFFNIFKTIRSAQSNLKNENTTSDSGPDSNN